VKKEGAMTKRSSVMILVLLAAAAAAVWVTARPAPDGAARGMPGASAQPGEESGGGNSAQRAIVVFFQLPNEKPEHPNQPWPGHILPENCHVPPGGELWLYNVCNEAIRLEFHESFFKEGVEQVRIDPGAVVVLHLNPDIRIANCEHDVNRAMYVVRGRPYSGLPTPNLYVP